MRGGRHGWSAAERNLTPKPKDGIRLHFHKPFLLNALLFHPNAKDLIFDRRRLTALLGSVFFTLYSGKQQHVALLTPQSPHSAAHDLLLLIVACECYYFSIDYLFFSAEKAPSLAPSSCFAKAQPQPKFKTSVV